MATASLDERFKASDGFLRQSARLAGPDGALSVQWVILFLCLAPAVFAVLLALQDIDTFAQRGESLSFVALLVKWLVTTYMWLPLLFPIWFAGRTGFAAQGKRLYLLAQFVAGPIIAYLHVLLCYTILSLVLSGPFALRHPRSYYFATRYFTEVILAYALMGCIYAVRWYLKVQAGRLERLALENELLLAQLRMLSIQLQPHFLFNALNSISSLMRKDVDAADDLLVELGSFLRQTLHIGSRTTITLEEELALAKTYHQLQDNRHQNRSLLTIDVAPALLAAQVPPMILQPLIENAFIHSKQDALKIDLSSRWEQNRIYLRLENNGAPFQPIEARALRPGIGLENIRSRLRCMYGDESSFTISNRALNGVCVEITIPFIPQG